MKNLQRGSVSLFALVFASFLMSLGGAGAAAAYFQKDPNEFMAQLRTYFAVHADEIPPLDTMPTPTGAVTPTGTPALTPTPTPTGTPTTTVTPTPTPTPEIEDEDDEDKDDNKEKTGESFRLNIHENKNWEFVKLFLRVRADQSIED